MYGKIADDMEEDLFESPVRRTTKSRRAHPYPLECCSVNVVMLQPFACLDSKPTAVRHFDGSAGGKLLPRRLQMDRLAASAALHAARKSLTTRCACFLIYASAHCNFITCPCTDNSVGGIGGHLATDMLCHQESEDDADEDNSLPNSAAAPAPGHPGEQPEVAAPLQAS